MFSARKVRNAIITYFLHVPILEDLAAAVGAMWFDEVAFGI